MTVWLLIYGCGDDGDECSVGGVFATEEAARKYGDENSGRAWGDGKSVEPWDVQGVPQ